MTRQICGQIMETSFGRLARLLPILAVLYLAVFPHSAHSQILDDRVHGPKGHELSHHHEHISSSDRAVESSPETGHFIGEHDEAGSHGNCSYLCDFVLLTPRAGFLRRAFPSIWAQPTEQLRIQVLSSDPPPPRVRS